MFSWRLCMFLTRLVHRLQMELVLAGLGRFPSRKREGGWAVAVMRSAPCSRDRDVEAATRGARAAVKYGPTASLSRGCIMVARATYRD